ncbi:XRE family transcriptional regulator [Pseudoalteromonas shioyasakiensis]|uniref:XRE family transcriptional regulator n=1 Tax=Pseudoalteromonas shioyasakiensis TaxID=1190813 RepID=UPI002741B8B3|nr:helix-turn-helix transcriptional regulator [Pseudoalteromonas shioyasakiensis]
MKDNSVTGRLWLAMQEIGVTKAELARAANVTPQAAGKWFKTNSISRESLDACAKRLGVSIKWLINGEGDKFTENVISINNKMHEKSSNVDSFIELDPWDSKTPLNDDEVEVPFYMEVELSAGNGSQVQLETAGPKLRFSKSTLRRHGIDFTCAACVKVTGNSMEPVIPDGATVGIDTANIAIKDGDMYAIDWAGALFVKTLTRRPGGGLRIRSFNMDEYPDENLTLEEAQQVRIIGRVFWYSVLR